MKKLLMVLALFLVVSVTSFGQAQDFTLINGTDFIITHVYISQSASDAWGEDVMTSDVLGGGEEVAVSFAGHDECLWDIKAVAEDGSDAVWTGIDLCEYFTITLAVNEDGPVAIFDEGL